MARGPQLPRNLTIASYNVKELGEFGRNSATTRSIARTIHEVDADIVALQEVPSQEVFDSFCENELAGDGYDYSTFFNTNDIGGHHLAYISRYPITDIESHKERTFPVGPRGREEKFARDVAEVEINVEGYPVKMYNVHFKAHKKKGGRQALLKRMAEMNEVHAIIMEDMKEMPSKLYVVAGDMNERPDDKGISLLKSNDEVPLEDPMEELKGQESHSFPQKKCRLDYIMLSPDMAGGFIPGSAGVHDSKSARKSSDHLPISLAIDMEYATNSRQGAK